MVMNQHIISRVAIYILAIVMFVFGIQHFIHPYDLLVKVPDFLPGGIAWVYIVGTAFVLAALSFVTNIWVRTAAYLLALLLFIFVTCFFSFSRFPFSSTRSFILLSPFFSLIS